MTFRLQVNGSTYTLRETDPDKPLLWVLRDELGLKATKYGCGVGLCGICTVLLDGEAHHACMVPLKRVGTRAVTTLEGLPAEHPVRRAWVAYQVPQCGYCQGGQMLAAAALLARHPQPADSEIDAALSGVLCRCGTYPRIRAAVRAAAAGEIPPLETADTPAAPPAETYAFDEWIALAPDGTVVLTINHAEMGQGALTGLVQLAAEELEVDPQRVRTVFAPADPAVYKNPLWGEQFTGGSSSIRGEWEPFRARAARVRARLIAAAARRWRVKAAECQAENGEVIHLPSGLRANYGELARAALTERAPRAVTLKPPERFRLIGRALPRLEIPDMVAGRTVYGIDVALPGMQVAVVARAPRVGGRLRAFDDTAARALPGVHDIVPISTGVAVVAKDFWSAWRGREALVIEWDDGPHLELDLAAIYAELEGALAREDGVCVREEGDARRALRQAAGRLEAVYRTPYLAHATLEPMNATAFVRRAERCDIWVGTQNQQDTQKVAARLTGLPAHKVYVHTQFLGGGFGRRLETDFVAEAVELSMKLGVPVQVIWTRADDLRHDKYRPAGAARLEAALDARGKRPLALTLRLAGSELVLEGVDIPYAIPNLREEHIEIPSPVPTGAWRSVGAGQNAFAIESFVDELAHAAGEDPYVYRRALLEHEPRVRAVLEEAAARAGWGEKLPPGRGRGIALYRSFGSIAAQVAEVDCTQGRIRVERVVCVIDCGIAVNPDAVRAQLEGAIVQGLSAALKEEVRIERGRVLPASFEDYPILTLAETPRIEVHLRESHEPPGGVGEPGIPPVAPAVANAVFAATGRRLRRLPLWLD
jgi:isoquinoline 1-oxidoreductase beta subunit